MLHNSGLYGSNDVNNMGAPRNLTQINGALLPSNSINSENTVQQQHMPSQQYDVHKYSNFAHPLYGIPLPTNPLPNYQSAGMLPGYSPPCSNFEHGNNNLNELEPSANRYNIASEVTNNLCIKDMSPNQRNNDNQDCRTEINSPQHVIKAFQNHMNTDISSEKKLVNKECQMTIRPHLLTELDSTRRKSLENTVRLIENILINSSKNRQYNTKKDAKDKFHENANIDKDPLAINNDKNKDIENMDDTQVQKTRNNDLTENTVTDKSREFERAIETRIELVPHCEAINVDNNVSVKIEPVCNWTDVDYNHPFHKDMHHIPLDDIEHDNIVTGDEGVNAAKDCLKNGIDSEKYFECQFCSIVFKNPKRFLIHIKWHTFGVAVENKSGSDKEAEPKKKEQKGKSTKNLGYPCKDCDQVFTLKGSLKRHCQTAHPNFTRECKICKSSVPYASMQSHLETHTVDRSFQCSDCPKKFKYPHSLAKHRDTHLEKVHPCTECPKMFGSPAQLKLHMKCHERQLKGPTLGCSYCGKAFYETYNLQVHERTHRNEKPFQCSICSTSYGTNSSLQRHIKVSHKNANKPFECPTCHRRFSTANIQHHHELRVHGDPSTFKYVCKLCNSRYLTAKDLRKHMYKMHPEAVKPRRRKPSESD